MTVISRRGRFAAKIQRGPRQIWLGTFDHEAEARLAIATAKRRLFPGSAGEFAVNLTAPKAMDDRAYREALRGDPCAYCEQPGGHLDHINPRSSGGQDGADNLTGACQACNGSKGTRSLLAFLLTRRLRVEVAALDAQIEKLNGQGWDADDNLTYRRGLAFTREAA